MHQRDPELVSEQSLTDEFLYISQVLSTTSNPHIELDWILRVKAIKRLQFIINNGGVAFSNFLEEFESLSPVLLAQTRNNSSAVVKEVCLAIVEVIEKTRDNFEIIGEKIVETLLNTLTSSTKVIVNSIDAVLIQMLDLAPSWRYIPKILETLKSRNTNLRIKAAGYILHAFNGYHKFHFQRGNEQQPGLLDEIEQRIKEGVEDSAPKVRELCRTALKKYLELFRPGVLTPDRTPQKKEESLEEIDPNQLDGLSVYETIKRAWGPRRAPARVVPRAPPLDPALEQFLVQLKSEQWNTKVHGLEKIRVELANQNSGLWKVLKSSKAVFERLLKSLIECAGDQHFKVRQVALVNTEILTDQYASGVKDHLTQVVQAVVNCLCTNKASVTNHANAILRKLKDKFYPDDILLAFQRCNVPQPKHKFIILENIADLAPRTNYYMANAMNITNFVQRIAFLIKNNQSKPLAQLGAKCLEAVRTFNKTQLIKSIIQLVGDEENAVKRAIAEHSPKIAQDLRLHLQTLRGVEQEAIIEEDELDEDEVVLDPAFKNALEKCEESPVEGLQQLDELINAKAFDSDCLMFAVKALLQTLHTPARTQGLTVIGHLADQYDIKPCLKEMLEELSGLYEGEQEELQALDRIIEQILLRHDSSFTIPCLISVLPNLKALPLKAFLGHLTNILQVSQHIKPFIAKLVQILRNCLNHEDPEVRKNSVMCMVELQLLLSNEFEPYLLQLTDSQQKLITIYVQKRLQDLL